MGVFVGKFWLPPVNLILKNYRLFVSGFQRALSFRYSSWELAASLKEAKEKFDSAGVKLIAVGVGTPDKAQLLAERVIDLSFLFLLPMNLWV